MTGMNRTHRVLDLLDLLRGRGLTPVPALAEELGVSERTVRRDLAVLRDRGWPIDSGPGQGGGVWLRRDVGIRAVHLRTEEVVALWIGAQIALSAGLPWVAAARSALNVLFAGLPTERARTVSRLADRLVIGRPASAAVRASLGPVDPALLPLAEEAVAAGHPMSFSYRDRHGAPTERTVEPHGLMIEAPAWYLLAYDPRAAGVRIFRMDRIQAPRVHHDERFEPDIDRLYARWQAQQQVDAIPPDRD